MNVIQIGFWQLMSMAGCIIVVLCGAAWVLVNIIVQQFTTGLNTRFQSQDTARLEREKVLDERFRGLEKAIKSEGDGWRVVEKDLSDHKMRMPLEYQRREDAIRFETVLNAKLDGIHNLIERLREHS
ncbi:MAG: hypothetical protein HOP06_11980 [Methylotenera sp.]|nr:hypothetical protein [Methylotenera sp.]